MGDPGTADTREKAKARWQGTPKSKQPRRAEWHPVGVANRCRLARLARSISFTGHLPPSFPGMAKGRSVGEHLAGPGQAFEGTRQVRPVRMLHRRLLCRRKKGGRAVGKTKRGKGTKVMAVADRSGLPIAIHIAPAAPHEVTLVEATLASRFILAAPQRLIGDRAYDSDPLDEKLSVAGIELIAPHKSNRVRPATQDGRKLRRYSRRWKIERLNAWLQNFRRVLVRYEHIAENYLGLLHLACIILLLNVFLR